MSRAQPLPPEERRAQILRSARAVFAQRGYHPASVADILEHAGVARGTFYNHFDSKQQIFQEVLAEVMVEVTAGVRPIDVDGDIPTQVRNNVRAVVRALIELGEGARVLFADAAGLDADGLAALADFYSRAVSRIERALRTGLAFGVVRPCEPALVAPMLLGMVKEPVLVGLLTGRSPDSGALVDEVERVLTAGVLGPWPS